MSYKLMFSLTPANSSDLVELSRLVNSSYRGESSRAGWTTEADFLEGQRTDPDSLQALISKPDKTILCLRQRNQNEIIGCVSLEKFTDHIGVCCYLGMLTVDPTLQSSGIGRHLLKMSEDYALKWGATRVTLGVIQLRESLIEWYERRGYKKTGETKPFPYGNPRAGLPKRNDLHFVMFEKSI